MLNERIKSCKECMHAKYEGNGMFVCDAVKKPVIIYDVPSEYHKNCLEVFGRIPPLNEPRQVAQFTRTGTLVKIYPSVRDAALELGAVPSCIYAVIQGKYQTHRGYTFAYVGGETEGTEMSKGEQL